MPTATLVTWFFGPFPGPLDSPLAKTTRHNPGILSFVGIPVIQKGEDTMLKRSYLNRVDAKLVFDSIHSQPTVV